MMTHGFLGYDASFMLDFVVTSLVLLVPLLLLSIYTVKRQKRYVVHKNMQLVLGLILLVAVVAFEVDMRMQGGWREIVNKPDSPPRLTAEEMQSVQKTLTIHLVFAISTPVLWVTTLALAYRRFPDPTRPSSHSKLHKRLGWLSTIDLVLTSITGLMFYSQAFLS